MKVYLLERRALYNIEEEEDRGTNEAQGEVGTRVQMQQAHQTVAVIFQPVLMRRNCHNQAI